MRSLLWEVWFICLCVYVHMCGWLVPGEIDPRGFPSSPFFFPLNLTQSSADIFVGI